VDLVRSEDLPGRLAEFQRLLPTARIIPISATRGDGHETLLKEMIGCLPVSPPFYPEEQVTDLYEREIAADLIREACLLLLRDEVPHGIAVRIDEYTERDSPDSRRDAGAFIRATLLLERDSHKGIVIGQNGSMLKKIGIAARKEIEAMSGRNVYLELRVKVRQNWRNDENVLRRVFD
jgi:GTP-binding protein Era